MELQGFLDGSTGFVASCGSYAADEMAKRQLAARKSLLEFRVTKKTVGDIYSFFINPDYFKEIQIYSFRGLNTRTY